MGGVMIIVLCSSVVDRGLEPQSGETKDYQNWYLLLTANNPTQRVGLEQSVPHHHLIEN